MNFSTSVLVCVALLVHSSEESLINKEDCGVTAIHMRIVNGSESDPGQWPWFAAIDRRGFQSIACGGTLINTSWVVTAAHCVIGAKISDITVYLGMNNKALHTSESNRKGYSIRSRTCHEEYHDSKNDICMLHLAREVSYTSYVLPICLPASGTSTHTGQTCVIVGFGATNDTAEHPNILQFAEVPIFDHASCSSSYPGSITSNHICAGYKEGGIDTCFGDSGGPLTCQEKVSSRDAYVLRGVTSFGDEDCAKPQKPGVYTAVEKYLDWIEKVISSGKLETSRTKQDL